MLKKINGTRLTKKQMVLKDILDDLDKMSEDLDTEKSIQKKYWPRSPDPITVDDKFTETSSTFNRRKISGSSKSERESIRINLGSKV